eukprot:GHVS01046741.1.p1 GENE.GHVS01046741.1~~GHVS01046741.1.p1  ORF type:complete len:112 (-),score=11.02 GHVS01046741.1:448-783(-)
MCVCYCYTLLCNNNSLTSSLSLSVFLLRQHHSHRSQRTTYFLYSSLLSSPPLLSSSSPLLLSPAIFCYVSSLFQFSLMSVAGARVYLRFVYKIKSIYIIVYICLHIVVNYG